LALAMSPAGPLRAETPEDRPFAASPTSSKPPSDGYWPRVLLSLAAVAGLIVLARFLLKKANLSSRGLGKCAAMEVLGRSSLSMKHQLVLVRLGQRVLLLGLSPQGVNTLSELTAAQEIAQVLDSLRTGRGDEFLKTLQDKTAQFAEADAREVGNAGTGAASAPGGSVRRLSAKLQKELGEDQP
jgi:flagellar biogenesis protein FliO